MRYVVSSTLLYSRLQNVERVIQPKSTLTIQLCFLFDIKDKRMDITASDNENIMKTTVDLVESSGDCKFAIEAKRLMDILKEIPEQPLTLEVDPNTLQIDLIYQNGQFRIQGEPGDEYPEQDFKEGEEKQFSVDSAALAKGLGTAIIATPDNDSRRVMKGVYLDIAPEDISIVGSDGHKLVCFTIKSDTQGTTLGFVMPQKPASILKTILDRQSGPIVVHTYGSSSAVVETPDYTISCRLIDEPYPNYKRVIPQTNNNVAIIDRDSLISAMRRVMVVSDKTTTLIKFQFEPNKVTLTSEDINYAQSAEEKLVCQYDGISLKMGFKGADLIELVNNIESDNIIMKLGDPSKAGLIFPTEQAEGTNLLMLLMPLIINS